MSEAEPPAIALPELPFPITLRRCDDRRIVIAHIVELTRTLAKTKVRAEWWAGLGVSGSRRHQEDDHHWNWVAEVGKYHNHAAVESVAVRTADGAIQAAMIYRLNGTSILASGAGAVYVDRLATAPRNRGWLVEKPLYRGAGTSLIVWAAYHSYSRGLDGRLVLAALPSERTIKFYESLGFKATTAEEDDMVVYELEPKDAVALLGRARGSP